MVLIEGQEQRIKALEQELKKDGHNSGKLPSQDSYERKQVGRKKPRSARKKKPGGQKGDRGTTLEMMSAPDVIRVYGVERCGCGQSLSYTSGDRV